ncbi:MAG: ArsA family ATPase [Acidimicrobiia bacterium]|nr:ArsA family ATPase [Acidimicrobiia bacterium]
MRVLLVTGKGGVGKTTVAAATALAAAESGYRTLVTSTDPAHSLADAFDVKLGDAPRQVVAKLDAQQIDGQQQLAKHWGAINRQLMAVFDWGGVRGIQAEEFLIFPGMDELFALLEVNEHSTSGNYDVIVVDCAPTAETLRLLSLPEVLSWYFDRVMPTERKIMRAARPILSRTTNLPMPSDSVFTAAEGIFAGVDAVKALLADASITSARLVINPEKMVVSEARRTYTYLSLFGYAIDGVVVNRVLPEEVDDPYFREWHAVQKRHLETIADAFADVEIMKLRLFDEEMVGIDRLRLLAKELYGGRDPIIGYRASTPFEVFDDGEDVVMALVVPFAEKSELDVIRHGDEVYITVGPYRRSFVLPDSLRKRNVLGAKFVEGRLEVRFGGER